MEGLSQRSEEVKQRWERYNIPDIVNSIIDYLRTGVIQSVYDLQKDMGPKLKRLLSRPERETTRGFLKWYFEKYSPKVLKGLKRVFGRMLQELIKYKVMMEIHLYSFPIQKATQEKLKELEEREKVYFYVRRLRNEVDKHLHSRGRSSRRADSLDQYAQLLKENFKKVKDQHKHEEQPLSDNELDPEQEQNMQNMMNEIMTMHGLGERIEPPVRDEHMFYGSFLREIEVDEEDRRPKKLEDHEWFDEMPLKN